MAATEAVLDTVELVENILMNIDIKTLLLSQRTSKVFQQTIKRYVHFKGRPFLKAAVPSEEDTIVNPLLKKGVYNGSASVKPYDAVLDGTAKHVYNLRIQSHQAAGIPRFCDCQLA